MQTTEVVPVIRCYFTTLVLLAAIFTSQSALLADGAKLVVGDIIVVTVDGEKDMSKTYQLDSQGAINVPMVGAIKVAGMSTSDAAAPITAALKKVLVNPEVTVAFQERAKMQVFVVGQVKTPGLVMVGVGDRVLQALAQAGYDESADLARVSVRRGGGAINVDLIKYLKGSDLSLNIVLESGDTIVVPLVDVVGYVMVNGQVAKVGKIALKQGTTFREVLGMAGGATADADTDNITIKREGATEPIRVNYKLAMDGDASADVKLQPGDVIYVKQLQDSYFTILGAVNKPGQYPLKGKVSLVEAIGLAGGPMAKVSDMKHVTVTGSVSNGKPATATNIDLTAVLAKAGQGPIIQPGDVISVGERKERTGMGQILQSLASVFWVFK
jgi:polysaccharide biosynthesis/export protein